MLSWQENLKKEWTHFSPIYEFYLNFIFTANLRFNSTFSSVLFTMKNQYEGALSVS